MKAFKLMRNPSPPGTFRLRGPNGVVTIEHARLEECIERQKGHRVLAFLLPSGVVRFGEGSRVTGQQVEWIVSYLNAKE